MFGAAGNKQEGQLRHHYRLIPDGFSSVVDIEGNESLTPSHRFTQGRVVESALNECLS